MNVNVMVNACVLVNSATICFSPFIFAIPMPGQPLENKPNFSFQYSVPLFVMNPAPAATTTATSKRKNYLTPKVPNKSLPSFKNSLWDAINNKLLTKRNNANSNAARFKTAISKMLHGTRTMWTSDYYINENDVQLS